MLTIQVILLTLLGVCFGSPDGIEQRVEVTKTAQQAVPAIAYGLDGFPYASQVVRPVQVKTTTTHRTEAAPLHAPANVAAHVAAAPVAAPVVQTNVVASAPVVATSPLMSQDGLHTTLPMLQSTLVMDTGLTQLPMSHLLLQQVTLQPHLSLTHPQSMDTLWSLPTQTTFFSKRRSRSM